MPRDALRYASIIAATLLATQAAVQSPSPRVAFRMTARAASSAPASISRGDSAAFTAAVYVARDGTRLPYRLLLPSPATPGGRYPLILQLHGSGAIGTDNSAQLGALATGWAAPAIRARFPAYVLVPQFADRTVDYRTENGMPVSRERAPLAAALELLDSLRAILAVDTTRVYAVGFSMGGSSVWHALLDRPAVFAAAMAIAGVPPNAADLRRVAQVPLLLLHGTADTENPFAATRSAYESLLRMDRKGVEFRSYPGLAHEIPPEVLTGDWWREWLFSHHR